MQGRHAEPGCRYRCECRRTEAFPGLGFYQKGKNMEAKNVSAALGELKVLLSKQPDVWVKGRLTLYKSYEWGRVYVITDNVSTINVAFFSTGWAEEELAMLEGQEWGVRVRFSVHTTLGFLTTAALELANPYVEVRE